MKLNRIFASLLILAVSATASFAAPAVNISWTNCGSTINANTTGGGVLDAFVYVLGQDQTAQSYEIWTYGGSPGGIKDAWRFDADGCEGSSFFTLNHLAPASVVKTCPSFQGSLASLQIKDYSYDATTGKARIVLANAYPNGGAGNPAATVPTQKYFLANYHFDLTFAVVGPSVPADGTCGGVESSVCWWISQRANWLDTQGTEHAWAHGQDFLTVNDAGNSHNCPLAVPATSKTWGQVKSQYRN